MQTHPSRRSVWFLRLLALLAAAVVAGPAAAGEQDRVGATGGARADGPDQLAQACPRIYRPVCAFTGGRWRTYNNACLARRRGARLIRQGACRAADTRRICCQRGRRAFFSTRRSCRRAGGRIVAQRFCRAPQRTCHQRRTSRRFAHIRGRSWHRACRAGQPQRTCHQRGTSRRFAHIRGRSWHRACGGAGVRPKPKPRAGTPCTGKDRHGVTFRGRTVVDRHGIATCMSNIPR